MNERRKDTDTMKCPKCNGVGDVVEEKHICDCPQCEGSGAPPCSSEKCVGSGNCEKCCPDCDALTSDGFYDGPCDRHKKQNEREQS